MRPSSGSGANAAIGSRCISAATSSPIADNAASTTQTQLSRNGKEGQVPLAIALRSACSTESQANWAVSAPTSNAGAGPIRATFAISNTATGAIT